ncbi:MAG: response regulator transcription factor [Roseiflexaceae bacterium]|nr:response regulator transcription factor [Roseiflexaceae bacterium]
MSIAILLVDDHPMFLFGLRTLIDTEPDMHVAGEVMTGAEAIAFVTTHPVDLVLMDIHLPNLNGIEATKRIREQRPDVRIVMLTMLDDDTVFHALKAGAHGYLLKGTRGAEMVHAIHAAASGEAIFSATVAQRIIQHFDAPPAVPAFAELTARERDILVLLARGLTNSAIAEQLSLSTKTVRNRVSDIFSKLHVHGRTEAIIKARDAGVQ